MVIENKKENRIDDKEYSRSDLNDIEEEPETVLQDGENKIEEDLTNDKENTNLCNNEYNNKQRKDSLNKKENVKKKQEGLKYFNRVFKTKYKNKNSVIITSQSTLSENNMKKKTEEITQPNPCPKYFGIKSYIDSFYYPPDNEVLNSGEFIQDDFEFIVEPGKRRWRNLWFKVGLWGGINLLLLGIIALLVGHLTPPRETVVSRIENLEVIDRVAITFNSRLQLCRLAGITIFCIGGVVLMLTLLISSYQNETTSYYVMNTALIPDIFTRMQGPYHKVWVSQNQIPLSGTLKQVQPH